MSVLYPSVSSFINNHDKNRGLNTVAIRVADDLAFYRIKDRLVGVEAGPFFYYALDYIPHYNTQLHHLIDNIAPTLVKSNTDKYNYFHEGSILPIPATVVHGLPPDWDGTQRGAVEQIMKTYTSCKRILNTTAEDASTPF